MPQKKNTKRKPKTAVKSRRPAAVQRPVVEYVRKEQPVRAVPESMLGGLGSLLGGGLGSLIGGPSGRSIGSAIGRAGGSFLGSVTGLGDYKVNKNSLMGGVGGVPTINNIPVNGSTIIQHKEYITDIITSSSANTFLLQSFLINPGQVNTFPFLAQLAENYEEYELLGMLFMYRSMSADALNSTNTALGSVIMATNYNAASANFASKAEMESYEFSSSCKPSVDMIHPIECAPGQSITKSLYVRPLAVPSGQDQRLYDWGNFQIATAGFQGTSVVIGELWVTYEVVLRKPKLYESLGLGSGYSDIAAAVTNGLPIPLSSVAANVALNTIGVVQTGTVITFPSSQLIQTYFVYILWTGGAVAVTAPTVALANCTQKVLAATFVPANAVTSAKLQYSEYIQTAGGAVIPTITFGAGGTLPTTSTGYVYILQVTNNLL